MSDPILIKKNKISNNKDGSQIASKRTRQTDETIQAKNKAQGIYNKSIYAGTNDKYNAWHSLTRVRNLGATIPVKAQWNPQSNRTNTFYGQEANVYQCKSDEEF